MKVQSAGFRPETGFALKPGIAPVAKKAAAPPKGTSAEELEQILNQAKANIMVVGCGGAGCNTVSRIVTEGIKGAETIAVNTDAQDLLYTTADRKVLIGRDITGGLGAGNDPEKGEAAARADEPSIKDHIYGADMVFVTCGLGGGTGTGSAPVVAEISKRMGALTVGVVTMPFTVEGSRRRKNADMGLEKLLAAADSVIVVPNDKILKLAPKLTLSEAFELADKVLNDGIKGVTELITVPGLVNLDFADMRAVLQNSGIAAIGIGESDSDNRAEEAAVNALNSPLLDVDITGAKGAIVNVISADVSTAEYNKIVAKVSEALDPAANIIPGAQLSNDMKRSVKVLVVLAGVHSPYVGPPVPKKEQVDLGLDLV
ncbi:MAG: cell division protein FtsZ [Candidatus Hadarchaeota archaeon]